jgi:site-specific DNA-methyltransferase (adenine-specific)
MPLKNSESILVFYQKLPTYNPQYSYGKPYAHRAKTHTSDNYGFKLISGAGSPDGRRFPCNIIKFNTVQGTIHPTQKPVELCEYLIKTYTDEGELVVDICAGSGTTAAACIRTGRRFICFENAPQFFALASERIQREQTSGQTGAELPLVPK